jgi:uncharacterized protein
LNLIKLIGIFLIAGSVFAFEVPPAHSYVNDYAKIFSNETVEEVAAKLKAYDEQTHRQFVVLTVPTIDGLTIETAAIKVANTWKLGDSDTNNGLLIMIAKKERKMRIEVGKGIEDIYTDVYVGRVIDKVLTPAFKSGKFDQGLCDAIDALVVVTDKAPEDNNDFAIKAFLVIIGIIIAYIVIRLICEDNSCGGNGSGGYSGHSYYGGGNSSSGSSSSGGRSGGSSGGSSGGGFSGGKGGGFSGGGSSGGW